MEKDKDRKVFQGMNLARIEANIEEFKKELGDRFISEHIKSNNPQWVIEVEYWIINKA